MNRLGLFVGGLLLLLMLLSSTLFIVDQRQVAVVYEFGQIKEVIQEPGLKWKLPPPFQNVAFLDRRIQTLDSPETRPIFTAEKKSLVIDWLVKWRVTDPRQFIRNNGADMRNLEARLSPIVHAAINEEVTKRTVGGVLSTERDKVMQDVRSRLTDDAKSFGIEVLDVRIKRVDFVGNITESIYSRMASERKQVANQLRSTGAAEGEKIRADADRQREVIVAEAYRDAQKVKGEGDAKASAIFAESFGRDPQFAQFYRSLEAYRASFRNKSDLMIVDPSSEFFKSMRGGRRRPLARASAAGAEIALGVGRVLGRRAQRRRADAGRRRPGAVHQPAVVAAHLRARAADERRPDPLSRPRQRPRRAGDAAGVLVLTATTSPRCPRSQPAAKTRSLRARRGGGRPVQFAF